jgi:hypothetical protein
MYFCKKFGAVKATFLLLLLLLLLLDSSACAPDAPQLIVQP